MQLGNTLNKTKRNRVFLTVIASLAFLFSASSQAIEAGRYYYFISDKCVAKGPQTPQERGAATPDIMLFEVVPAGISDYYVNMNTQALVHYTETGQDLLSSLESEQAYTAGKTAAGKSDSYAKDGSVIHHDFMLQREAISLKTLIETLNGFSQLQSDKGYFFKKIVGLSDTNMMFKAVTRVRLTDNGIDDRMLLSDYSSSYYPLDDQGYAAETPFISVDHNQAMRTDIHEPNSPYAIYTKHYVCGERWEPGN